MFLQTKVKKDQCVKKDAVDGTVLQKNALKDKYPIPKQIVSGNSTVCCSTIIINKPCVLTSQTCIGLHFVQDVQILRAEAGIFLTDIAPLACFTHSFT